LDLTAAGTRLATDGFALLLDDEVVAGVELLEPVFDELLLLPHAASTATTASDTANDSQLLQVRIPPPP
jgi:hypothetical protein